MLDLLILVCGGDDCGAWIGGRSGLLGQDSGSGDAEVDSRRTSSVRPARIKKSGQPCPQLRSPMLVRRKKMPKQTSQMAPLEAWKMRTRGSRLGSWPSECEVRRKIQTPRPMNRNG